MSRYAIQVEGLSKQYVIGAREAGYQTLREALVSGFTAPFRRFVKLSGDVSEEERIWALKDVCFEIEPGEVVGIIGRNGAGKSTLLKILSRITAPTAGCIRLYGRISSLLEVGTGFHAELTGRENIYLNGTILGMTRTEIRRKFDEIVAFSDLEQFLDTPVKRYSTGMYMRLAFAVAAHLDPEILAVDEVLAVGDASFQQKCVGKMGEVARGGRTVLFVSHNMHAVEKLCRRIVYLEGGRLAGVYNNVREGIMSYLASRPDGASANAWINQGGECENDYFVPQRLEMSSLRAGTRPGEPFSNDYPIVIKIVGTVRQQDPALNVGVSVYTEDGEPLFYTFASDTAKDQWPRLATGQVRLRTEIPAHLLNEGTYRVQITANLRHQFWLLDPEIGSAASVMFSIRGGLSSSPVWNRKRQGILAPVLAWENF